MNNGIEIIADISIFNKVRGPSKIPHNAGMAMKKEIKVSLIFLDRPNLILLKNLNKLSLLLHFANNLHCFNTYSCYAF